MALYFGINAISINALAIDGWISGPRWESKDNERLGLSIDDRIFHRNEGTGRIFGFLYFNEEGAFNFVRESSEFDVRDIDQTVIQNIQNFIIEGNKDVQFYIDRPIPVVLFDYRNADSAPLIIVIPTQLFVSKGCLRGPTLKATGYSGFMSDFINNVPIKREICVDHDVVIDHVEGPSFSVYAVNPYTTRILLENHDNANTVIVQAADVTREHAPLYRRWCNDVVQFVTGDTLSQTCLD